MQEIGANDTVKEVVLKEAVTKEVADEVDASIAQHIHHLSKTSRKKLTILARS